MNGQIVRAYSLKRDGAKKIRPHFTVREFACKDGTDAVFVSDALVAVLEQVRLHFGKPIIINSGYRTPPHNRAQGGSPTSQHMYGMAADIVVRGVEPRVVAAYAEQLLPASGGVGRYKTFTHIDVRSTKSRWNG